MADETPGQTMLAVYLDKEDPEVNEEVLKLVRKLVTAIKLPGDWIYVRYVRYQYAGLMPILYGLDGKRVRGLRRIREYVDELFQQGIEKHAEQYVLR